MQAAAASLRVSGSRITSRLSSSIATSSSCGLVRIIGGGLKHNTVACPNTTVNSSNLASHNTVREVGTTANVSEWPFPFVQGPPEKQRLIYSQLQDSYISRQPSAIPHVFTTTPKPTTVPTKPSTIAKKAEAIKPAPVPTLNTHYSLFAKRPTRLFPPPFTPPELFENPNIIHPKYNGLTNGDDAILVEKNFLSVADGVGAWNTRMNGHAALWARLMVHYWGKEMSSDPSSPVMALQKAYETVCEVTVPTDRDGIQHEWQGTTTFCGASVVKPKADEKSDGKMRVGFLNLGDSQGFLIRPKSEKVIFKTTEQWHWFDCPVQLGTNSKDTPLENADYTVQEVQVGDIILLATDGLMDNLWEHEILDIVMNGDKKGGEWTAQELIDRAVERGRDPFTESPYMERAVDNGLATEGGKYDDVSVVLAKVVGENGKVSLEKW